MRRFGLAVWIAGLLLLNACTLTTGTGTGEAAQPAEQSTLDAMAHAIADAIEVAGIGVIVMGGLVATTLFGYQLTRRRAFDTAYHQYRSNLGRGILLGLEFLVAADIIGTVAVDPTFQNLGVLGLIVLIRTFLSFSLEIEIEGHVPWRETELRRRGLDQTEF